MELLDHCPDCGKALSWDFDPPYQEYPGASTQGGYHYANCECGWEDSVRDTDGFEPRENTRGW